MNHTWKDTAIGFAVIATALAALGWAAITGANVGALLSKVFAAAIIGIPAAALLMLILLPFVSGLGGLIRRRP